MTSKGPGFFDSSSTVYRGMLVPSPRIGELWAAESSYTEEGSQPGVVVPGQETGLAIRGSGNLEADVVPLEITGCRSGFPARDLGARVAIRRQETPEGPWHGHWASHLIAAHERLPSISGQTAGNGLQGQSPSVTTMPDGGALAVWSTKATGGTLGSYVRASYRTPGGLWTNTGGQAPEGFQVALLNNAVDLPPGLCAVVALPDGRALCFVVHTENGLTRADTYSSADLGVNWSRSASSSVPGFQASRWVVQRVSAAYGGPGEICLLLHVDDQSAPGRGDVLMQFASADFGSSFQLVQLQDGGGVRESGTDPLRCSGGHDVTADRAGFVVTYAEPNDAQATDDQGVLYSRRLASAYSVFGAADPVRVAGITEGGLLVDFVVWGNEADQAITADRNGTLWCYWREYAADPADGRTRCRLSTDGGTVWQFTSDGFLPGIGPGNNGDYSQRRLSACWERGRVLLVHGWTQLGATYEQALCCQVLGGWMAANAPVRWDGSEPGSLASQASADFLMLPARLPETAGWTLEDNGGGANAHSISGGYSLSVRADGTDYVRWKQLGAVPYQWVVNGFLDVAVSIGKLGLELQCTREGASVRGLIWVYVDLTTVYVYSGLGLLGQLQLGTNVDGYRIQVAAGLDANETGGSAEATGCVWARIVSTTVIGSDPEYPYDPAWKLVYSGAVGVGGDHTTHFKFGALGNTGATAGQNTGVIFQWQTWQGEAASVENRFEPSPRAWASNPGPTEMEGRALTVIPEHSRDGLYLSAFGGPMFDGDTFVHSPQADWAAENLNPLVSRSPRVGWRASASEAPQAHQFAWDLNGFGDTYPGSSVVGVHVEQTNHPTWLLEGYVQGVGWSTLATVDTREAFGSLSYNLESDAATLALSVAPVDAPDGYYLHGGELVGGTFYTDAYTDAVPIVGNTGGLLGGGATAGNSRIPRLFLDNVEAQSIAAPAVGVGYLAPNRFTVLVPIEGPGSGYRALRLTATEDLQGATVVPRAGLAVVGAVHLFGIQFDRSRTTVRRAAVDLDQDVSGAVHVRKRGPSRRSVGVNWTENGVWTRQLYTEHADEYALWGPSTIWAVSSIHELPLLMDELAQQLNGALVPIVLLQDVPALPDGASQLVIARNEAGSAIYGHVAGDLSVSWDYGRVNADERATLSMGVEEETA